MTDFLIVTSWDPPQLTQHFGNFAKQVVGQAGAPWVSTLCGRSLLANGEHEDSEMCEICEDAFDDE